MDALIVASTPARQHALTDILNREKIVCVVCSTAAEARRASVCRPFDLFVIYSGLIDEHGNELALNIAEQNECGGIYIEDSLRAERLESDLGDFGIVTLSLPITRVQLLDAVRLISVSSTRVRILKAKNEELMAKLEDMKYITRAKIALMRSHGYTEEQAHKIIEKRAMASRQSRRKVAMDILTAFEEN